MQFKIQTFVRAMKPSKGVIEDTGRHYDSTKVYIDTEFSTDTEGFGTPSIEYNWGTSDNYYAFVKETGINKSFSAEVTFENQTTGKSSRLAVVGIKPTQAASQSK